MADLLVFRAFGKSTDDVVLVACSTLLEALSAVSQHDVRKIDEGYTALDSIVRIGTPVGELRAYIPIVMTQLAAAAGKELPPITWLHPYMEGWPMYVGRYFYHW